MKYRTSSAFSSYLLSISYRHDRLVSPNPNILCATYRKRKWRLRRNWKELFFAVWNGTPSFNWQHQYVWIVCKKRGGLCRLTESVCVVASNKRGWKAYTTFTSCENVAYSNKVFFLCWVGYALEGSIFHNFLCFSLSSRTSPFRKHSVLFFSVGLPPTVCAFVSLTRDNTIEQYINTFLEPNVI